MIKFGIIKIEGFASIQKLEVDWSGDKGIVLIQARNGSGKSRLINALYWVLFGKSMYGSVETWQHLKPKDYKGVKVELSLTIGEKEYTIIRCLNYTGKVNGFAGKNRLIVIEDGVEWNIKDKRNIQLEWISVLKYTPELFMNSIIFGQKQKRLMDNRGSEKKELFDEAFDTYILNQAYLATTESVKEVTIKLDALNRGKSSLMDKLNLYEREEEREKEREAKFYQDIKNQISEIKNQQKELKANREPVSNQIGEVKLRLSRVEENSEYFSKKIQKLESKSSSREADEISEKILGYQKEVFSLNKEIAKLNRSIWEVKGKTVCPTCGKPYEKREIASALETLNKEVSDKEKEYHRINQALSDAITQKNKLKEADQVLVSFREDLNQVNYEKSKLEINLANLLSKQKEYEGVDSIIKGLSDKIRDLKSKEYQGKNYRKDIDKINTQIKGVKKEIIKHRVNLKRLKFSQELFSNKGMKSWLFSFLLEKVNEMLSNYSRISGFNINFWVDLESTKGDIYTLIERYGEEVPYEDLSGGQQQLVNLLSIFAVMDVIQEKRPCPLFIGDELFESLDPHNVQMVGNIIRQKSQNKKMFIVSHLEDFILENAQIIKLENVEGQTVLS